MGRWVVFDVFLFLEYTEIVINTHTNIHHGMPKKRWLDVVRVDMRENDLTIEDAQDRARWRRLSRKADPGTSRDNTRYKKKKIPIHQCMRK